MRIYYTTDLHGSDKCWRKFLATPKFYQADFIVIGGDITGKIIVPIIRLPKGRAEATFMGRKRKLKKEKDIEELKLVIANTGQYPVEMTQEEFQSYEEDPSQLDDLFRDILVGRVEEWIKMADERLKGQKVSEIFLQKHICKKNGLNYWYFSCYRFCILIDLQLFHLLPLYTYHFLNK